MIRRTFLSSLFAALAALLPWRRWTRADSITAKPLSIEVECITLPPLRYMVTIFPLTDATHYSWFDFPTGKYVGKTISGRTEIKDPLPPEVEQAWRESLKSAPPWEKPAP